MVRLCADPLHMNGTMVPYFDRPIAFPFREALHIDIRDLKIHDAIARRRVTKTKQIFTEDNNYE